MVRLYSEGRNILNLLHSSLFSSLRPLTFPASFCPADSVSADDASRCGSTLTCALLFRSNINVEKLNDTRVL